MYPLEARHRFAAARVARMATVDAAGRPHVVPVTFALVGDGDATVFTAVDHKAKTTTALKRVRNVAQTGRVSLLVDHYDEDWALLWWVRVDGAARVLAAADDDARAGLDALVAKYPQYAGRRPDGPVIAVGSLAWRCWTAGQG